MKELMGLLARFDAVVYSCGNEMRELNECYLNLGAASDRCTSVRDSFNKCQQKMKEELNTINSICGSQHQEYTSCMHGAMGQNIEQCKEPLSKFVGCAEVWLFPYLQSYPELTALKAATKTSRAFMSFLKFRNKCLFHSRCNQTRRRTRGLLRAIQSRTPVRASTQ